MWIFLRFRRMATLAIVFLSVPVFGENPQGIGPLGQMNGPGETAVRRNFHDLGSQQTEVVDLVLSPDGRRLAAAYYVHAMNCPGTDWDAWVAVWDLDTGKRTIVANATHPLAISPDGQWLAMGLYDRTEQTGHESASRAEIALWKTGEIEPARKLKYDTESGRCLAWTFSADGKELLAINEDRSLLRWPLDGDSPAEKLGRINLPDKKTSDMPGNQELKVVPPVKFHARDNKLCMIGSLHSTAKSKRVCCVKASWVKWTSKWSGPHVSDFENTCVTPSWPADELSLPVGLARPFVREYAAVPPPAYYRPRGNVAFFPAENLTAFMAPNASQAMVVKVRGEQIARLPAAAVHEFTPDGKQLIVSDSQGVLRFWDFNAGRIVRSLRLDDKPAETFLVAAIQAASEFGKPERNREELESLVRSAAIQGARIVVLPETAVTGYMSDDLKQTWQVGERPVTSGLTGVDPKDAAEMVPGPSTQFFSKIAREYGIYLSVPLLEVDRKTGKYYNTIVLLGPDGGILIHYRKLNPWPWAERGWASEGNLGHPVVDTPFGRIGVLVCFDIHKQAAELAKLKIDTLLYSIAWVEDEGSDWFPKRLPQIAAKCKYNIIAANWTVGNENPKPSWHGYGQSTVIDAGGRVVTRPQLGSLGKLEDSKQGIIMADLPLPNAAEHP